MKPYSNSASSIHEEKVTVTCKQRGQESKHPNPVHSKIAVTRLFINLFHYPTYLTIDNIIIMSDPVKRN